MAVLDAYNDGLAIEITLSLPATEADVQAARQLLNTWLDGYSGEHGIGYRNCGSNAEVGATEFVLWADRLVHADGDAASIAAAEAAAEQARETLPTRAVRVTSASEAADDDAVDRLGQPVFHIRPGGNWLADIRAADAGPLAGGLRPSMVWIGVVVVVRFVTRRYETDTTVLTDLATSIAIAALTVASHLRLSRWQRITSAVVTLLLLSHGVVGLLVPEARLAEAVLAMIGLFVPYVWAVAWLWRR